MTKLLDLSMVQARLEPMVSTHVNYVGRSANYVSALVREADLPASLWVYPLATETGEKTQLSGGRPIIERFAVLSLHRDINTAPDAGAALQASVRLIREGVIELIEGWRPEGWRACQYAGGAQRAGGDRLYAWEDQFVTSC
jgi:hypothetical protein